MIVQYSICRTGNKKLIEKTNIQKENAKNDLYPFKLIVDLDLRKPKINRSYGLSNTGGVSDFVKNEHSVHKNIKKVEEKSWIYPNPSSGILTYTAGNMEIESLSICNMLGVCVYLNTVENRHDLSHLSDGVYIVTVKDKNGAIKKTKWAKKS